jgi:hypothetical protein
MHNEEMKRQLRTVYEELAELKERCLFESPSPGEGDSNKQLKSPRRFSLILNIQIRSPDNIGEVCRFSKHLLAFLCHPLNRNTPQWDTEREPREASEIRERSQQQNSRASLNSRGSRSPLFCSSCPDRLWSDLESTWLEPRRMLGTPPIHEMIARQRT